MNILKFYKNHISDFKFRIITLIIISTLSLFINLFSTYFTGKYIDLLLTNVSINWMYKFILAILCITGLNILLKTLSQYFNVKTQSNVVFKLNYSILQHVKKLPISYFNDVDIVYLNQRINTDTNVVINFIISILVNVPTDIITLLFIIFFLFKRNIIISIVALLSIPIYTFLYIKFKLKLYETSYEVKEEGGKFFSHMYNQLSNMKFIKINVLFNKLDDDLIESFPTFLNSVLKNTKYNCFFSSTKSIIESLFNSFLFFYGGIQVFNNNITIGEFLIIKNYYTLLLNTISKFVEAIKQYPATLASHNRINDILKLNQEHNGSETISTINSIQLDKVSFSYDNEQILKEFSYTFEKGNVYLISGDNGTGKSTLIDVLLGLHIERYEGNVYYNNLNIEELDLYSLRKSLVSVLEQEPLLTNYDIYEHLPGQKNKIGIKDIEYWVNVFELNNIDERTRDKDNVNAIVSGGEKQKIALARTLIKNADVLIMDEPTSALDEGSIETLKKIINKIKSDKIIIIITHNLKLKNIADNVIEI